ncbi:MAG: DUF1287 domain-containing protein [Deltaproteobacteria bacterium]|nr:DUF1287 domain-containing protein [Deltaproteobacteria bacterium]
MPLISISCGSLEADPAVPTRLEAPAAPQISRETHAGESCLGVSDKGVFGDLDGKVQITLPAKLAKQRVSARVDAARKLLVLAIDGFPRKAYPLDGTAKLVVGTRELALRPGDRAELAPLLVAERITDASSKSRDHDKDGIPDPLDVLIGAKKTVLNGAAYTEGWTDIRQYPGGDVPRTQGVCTDVIVRAVRNAGVDLQKELHEDIKRARAVYPKNAGNWQIDQRRVLTLLPYFQRHWEKRTAKLDDPDDPLRPGDVILMDTFPSKFGPDHIGIISDTIGESGLPLVINNWTVGYVESEMDLLTSVPVLYRYRLPE